MAKSSEAAGDFRVSFTQADVEALIVDSQEAADELIVIYGRSAGEDHAPFQAWQQGIRDLLSRSNEPVQER